VRLGGTARHGGSELVRRYQRFVAEWDGHEPAPDAWNAARIALENRARAVVEESRERALWISGREREQQRHAARLRVIEELGRLLICFPQDGDDQNVKFHRLASEPTPTAERLKVVFNRLGDAYPDWDSAHLAELRAFRNSLTPAQVRTRLTCRELEAALMDPRWEVGVTAGSVD
jgi:hypothetical protein